MTIIEAHYDFKLKIDKVDSLSKEDFNPAEIDWLLNEAQLDYVKRRYSPQDNPYRTGFEMSQKRIDDLAHLHIKHPLQAPVTPSLIDGVYEVRLCDLDCEYMFLTRVWGKSDCDGCEVTTSLTWTQNDDLNDVLDDPFNSPTKKDMPYNVGRSSDKSDCTSIYAYKNAECDLTSVYVEYIKYPAKVNLGTYVYIDGVTYPTQTFELADHTHNEIVDYAVQIASGIIEHPSYYQLKTQKIFNHE